MKRLSTAFALFVALGLALASGYWIGFRHAWSLGLQADAPVRGSLAIGHLKLLDTGRLSDLQTFYESEIDSALIWWAQLEDYPMFRYLNVLSGHEVVPDHERYVKRVANYRRTNKSPLRDVALVESMLQSAREKDAGFADELERSSRDAEAAIDRMVEKYGQ
jgi:hypothetical protein